MKKIQILLTILCIGLMSISIVYAQESHLAAEDDQLLTEADRPGAAGTQVLRDNATGGDCSSIGTWDSTNKVCTLNTDVADSVLILDPLTLDCNGHEISNPGLLSVGVTVAVDGVTVQNCRITGFGTGIFVDSNNNLLTGNTIRTPGTSFPNSGVLSFGTSNNVVASNDIDDAFFGVVWVGGSSNVIEDNLIGPTTSRGIELDFNFKSTVHNNVINTNLPGSRGIFDFAGNSNTLSSNTVSGSGFFNMRLDSSNQDKVIGNTVSGARFFGIQLRQSSDNLIADNDISDSDFFGISATRSSDNNEITRNKIRRTNPSGPGGFGGGVFVSITANDNLITSNDIEVTDMGVHIERGSNGNTVSDNKITSTRLGVSIGTRVQQGSNDNLILNNVINSESNGIVIQLGERNRAEGNTIRMGGGAGIVVNSSTDAELVKNEVHKKAGDGLVLLSSPTTQVTLNDIWLNGGVGVNSNASIVLLQMVQNLVLEIGGMVAVVMDCLLKESTATW